MSLLVQCLITVAFSQVTLTDQGSGHYPSTLDIAYKQMSSPGCHENSSLTDKFPKEKKTKAVGENYKLLVKGEKRIYVKLHMELKTWHEALHLCQKEGGTLGKLDSREKSKLFRRKFRHTVSGSAWIGLSDRYDNDTWLWTDGTRPGLYNNWGLFEPNNYHDGRKENCAGIILSGYGRGKWFDTFCTRMSIFFCERRRK